MTTQLKTHPIDATADRRRAYSLPTTALIAAAFLSIWLYLEIDVTALPAIISALVVSVLAAVGHCNMNRQLVVGYFIAFLLLGLIATGFATPTLFGFSLVYLVAMLTRSLRAPISVFAISFCIVLVMCLGMVQWNRFYGRLTEAEIVAIRARNPVIDLRARLDYESSRVHDLPAFEALLSTNENPFLLKELRLRGTLIENPNSMNSFLKILHSRQAHIFANREGFGVWRLNPTPTSYRVDSPALENIYFDKTLQPAVDPEQERKLYRDWWRNWDQLLWTIDQEDQTIQLFENPNDNQVDDFLSWVHTLGVADFFQSQGFGAKIQNDHWAGFVPHAFHIHPLGDQARDELKLLKLELVSILKYDQPRVYVLDQLPRMDLLSQPDILTRGLDSFETQSLQRLRNSQADIFTTRINQEIRMLGALRAQRICTECHDVNQGDLLGAFSYRLAQSQINSAH